MNMNKSRLLSLILSAVTTGGGLIPFTHAPLVSRTKPFQGAAQSFCGMSKSSPTHAAQKRAAAKRKNLRARASKRKSK